MKELIDRLKAEHTLSKEEYIRLLTERTPEVTEYLYKKAAETALEHYGNRIFVRGLIEFTNYCKNNCYYCGIRRGNKNAQRYRLTREQIETCCERGYELGFRTFVLQGGEDPWYTDEKITDLVQMIKNRWPDCAVTLSVGEKSRETYQKWFDAGADRYLLRHETANPCHYGVLHPSELSAENRKQCLRNLKEIGYQTGAGIMVGSPGQTAEYIAEDLLFLYELQPEMVGIGPFIPHHETPFAGEAPGTLEDTLFLLGLVRLILPSVLLPATTALGTIHPKGREMGVFAGANVVMPNLSPENVREKYMLYDNKICTGDEAAEAKKNLEKRMEAIGYQVVTDRGDWAE